MTNGAKVYISSRDGKACEKAAAELTALGTSQIRLCSTSSGLLARQGLSSTSRILSALSLSPGSPACLAKRQQGFHDPHHPIENSSERSYPAMTHCPSVSRIPVSQGLILDRQSAYTGSTVPPSVPRQLNRRVPLSLSLSNTIALQG